VEFSVFETRLYVPESVVNLDPMGSFRPDAFFVKWGSDDDAAFFFAEYLRIAAMILPAEYIFLARSVDFVVDFVVDFFRPAPVFMHLYGDLGERRCPAPCDSLHGSLHV